MPSLAGRWYFKRSNGYRFALSLSLFVPDAWFVMEIDKKICSSFQFRLKFVRQIYNRIEGHQSRWIVVAWTAKCHWPILGLARKLRQLFCSVIGYVQVHKACVTDILQAIQKLLLSVRSVSLVHLFDRQCSRVPLCWNCYDQHQPDECGFLQHSNLPKGFLIDHFDVVTPLRLLLFLRKLHGADQSSARCFNDIIGMESHFEQRQNSMVWHQHRRNIIDPMRNNGLYKGFVFRGQHIDDNFMQKICGILDVNSFDVRTPSCKVLWTWPMDVTIELAFWIFYSLPFCDGGQDYPVRGLYPDAALMAHDCIANTFITMDHQKELKVYASVDIKSGDMIYYNYTDPLMVSIIRRMP